MESFNSYNLATYPLDDYFDNKLFTVLKDTDSDILYGDLYKDDKLTVVDIIILQRYLHSKDSFTQDQFTLADMNSDGKVNVFDLVLLKKAVLAK